MNTTLQCLSHTYSFNDFLQHGTYKQKIKKNPCSGVFGEDMLVKIENDGPVTIFIDSKNKE